MVSPKKGINVSNNEEQNMPARLPEGLRCEMFPVIVRVDLGDEATELTEDSGKLSSSGHVLPPASQAGLLSSAQVRLEGRGHFIYLGLWESHKKLPQNTPKRISFFRF